MKKPVIFSPIFAIKLFWVKISYCITLSRSVTTQRVFPIFLIPLLDGRCHGTSCFPLTEVGTVF